MRRLSGILKSGIPAMMLFAALLLLAVSQISAANGQATYVVDTQRELGKINKDIYGNFAEHLGRCVYGGIWVGEDSDIPNTRGIRNDVVQALKKMKLPMLRWPGGCFADTYHWKDGIGPKDERPARVNMFWGDVIESNAFGTHEFMDLIDRIGADPYIAGNVGSGSPEEMNHWVEYMTYPGQSTLANMRRENGRDETWQVPLWGVGNENWGCGGGMTVNHYKNLFRQFATYLRNYGDNELYLVAGGPGGRDPEWLQVMMEEAGDDMDGISMHYYTVPHTWAHKGSSTDFKEDEWFLTLQKSLVIEDIINEYTEIMDRFDPDNNVGLIVDEWGTWYDPLPGTNPAFLEQQNTLRDALVAASTLNIFNEHSRRIKAANIAQLVNVLQAVILTDGDKMVTTPTFHAFEMMSVHQDAQLLDASLETPEYKYNDEEIPQVSVSASKGSNGQVNLSYCNFDPNNSITVSTLLKNMRVRNVSGRVLTARNMTAKNTFDNPDNIQPASFKDFKTTDDGLDVTLPAKSVVVLTVQ